MTAPPTAPNPAAAEPMDAPPRRMPLRFVWQMDAEQPLLRGVEDFARLLGPNTAAVLIRPWAEIAETLKVDTRGEIARALSLHSTWSGIVIDWPTDEASERLPIEMSGLPVFDRDRQYAGYRGFGICRDMEKLALLERHRAQAASPPPQPKPEEPAPKVVPFPATPPQPEPPPVQPEPPPPAAQTPPAAEPPQLKNRQRGPNRRRSPASRRRRSAPASTAPSRSWRAN